MTCSEARFQALAVGPAAVRELDSGPVLRVHGVFPGAVNLVSAEGLVTLTGASGCGYPHTVAVLRPGDFRDWELIGDGPVRIRDGALRLPGRAGGVTVELTGADRPPAPRLEPVPRLAGAHRACLARLATCQADTGCALTLDGPPASPMGQTLRRRVLDLAAALAPGRGGEVRLRSAVAALAGLGPGLTPTGDDVLCGFLAAAGPSLAPVLAAAMAANLDRTGPISARLMRVALQGFWPAPLARLAAALAGNAEPEALAALDALMRSGHSSGADLATGYLLGLS